MTLYAQSLDAGYSAPGQSTVTDTEYYGGTFRMPVTSTLSVGAKADWRSQDQGLETSAVEVDVSYDVTDEWSVSTGVRNDRREDRSIIVPLTQQQGERTDAVVQGRLRSQRSMARVRVCAGHAVGRRGPRRQRAHRGRAAPTT